MVHVSKKQATRHLGKSVFVALIMSSTALTPLRAAAAELPTGANVTAGQADITSSGSQMLVNQSSKNAIINWDSFSIGNGAGVTFNNGTGATLNRVQGTSTSKIDGSLSATGDLFLINQNGIVIGKDGVIETGGKFVASTLDVSDADFLDGGDMTFSGNSSASVINLGKVGSLGGDVAFIARHITNEGELNAPNGTVGLAAGREVLMRDASLDDGKFLVKVGDADSSIMEAGVISAATAELRANGGNIYALAGNDGGAINATGVATSGGRIFLTAGGGKVRVSKKVRATRGGNGGEIFINADEVSIGGLLQADGVAGVGGNIDIGGTDIYLESATIDASGTTGGGRIRVGGEYQGGKGLVTDEVQNAQTVIIDSASTLTANGTGANADGGTVIVWSDDATKFAGTISARGSNGGNGGFAEVSGKQVLSFAGQVDLRSDFGSAGTLLLDPTNFTIDNSNGSSLVTTLNGGTNVVIATDSAGSDAGDIVIDYALSYSGAGSLTFLAHHNIEANADIQNSGSGDLNLIAGWDGTTDAPGSAGINNSASVTIADFTAGTYGNNGGSILIGDGAQTNGIAVGSAFGTTTALGAALTLTGSNTANKGYAQLGYYSPGKNGIAGGAINVRLTGDLTLSAGSSNYADALVGHGGSDNGASFPHSASHSGDINVEAANVALNAAGGRGSFAQIGNGGFNAEGSDSGDITITASGDISLNGGSGYGAFAHIGNGGKGSGGSAGETVTGNVTVNASGDISLVGGDGLYDFALIGLGGGHYGGDLTGDTTVIAGGDIMLVGGTGLAGNYAQIGAGALGLTGGGATTTGNVYVSATGNTIMVTRDPSYYNYSLLGNGTASDGSAVIDSTATLAPAGGLTVLAVGDVDIESRVQVSGTGDVALVAGWDGSTGWMPGDTTANMAAIISNNAYGVGGDVNIGDGAQTSGIAVGSKLGTTTVLADNLILTGGGMYKEAQLGYGGGGTTGAIDVKLAGDLTLDAGIGEYSFAKIGHGGPETGTDIAGDITIDVAGDINLDAGSEYQAFAQIGHSAFFPGSINLSGSINVTAGGAVNLNAGSEFLALAQIGHSVFEPDIGTYTANGDITVSAASLALNGGDGFAAYAQLGHGGLDSLTGDAALGTASGAININTTGDTKLEGGTGDYATVGIGHFALDNVSGVIDVTAGRTVGVAGGTGTYSEAIIGHGSEFGSVLNSAINVSGTSLLISGGDGTETSALVGHQAQKDVSGGITLNLSENLVLSGGTGDDADAQVGHFSNKGMVSKSDINGTVGGFLQLNGGSGYDADVQIGHQGRHGVMGNIDIAVIGNVSLIGGGNDEAYAQIGHTSTNGYTSGSVGVSGNQLLVMGGTGPDAFAQIGHVADDMASGTLNLNFAGDLALSGGTGSHSYVQLGHFSDDGDISGNISLAGANLSVAGGTAEGAEAQIGHWGYAAADGAIGVSLTGDAFLMGGSDMYTGAYIGNVSYTKGASGDIDIDVAGDLAMAGGSTNSAYAMIGHGDAAGLTSGTRQGNINVIVGGEASLEDNSGSGALAWIGHGTTTANGISDANVYLQAFGFDRSINSTLAAGGLGAFNKDIVVGDIPGGNFTLIATGTGLELQDPVYNSPFQLLVSVNNDLVLASGATFTNTGTGDVILAAGGNFHNDTGSLTPIVTGGRWLIYSTRPDNNRNDIEITNWDFLRYSTTFDINDPAPSSFASGNGLIYQVTPVVNLLASDETIYYGQTPTPTITQTLSVNGVAVNPADFGLMFDTSKLNFSYGSNVLFNVHGQPFVGSYPDGLVPKGGLVTTYHGIVVNSDPGNLTVLSDGTPLPPTTVRRTPPGGQVAFGLCSPSEDDLSVKPYDQNTGQICTLLPTAEF